MTVFAIFLGIAGWRRNFLIRENAELKMYGVGLLWEREPIDAFWPVIPETAEFAFTELSKDEILIGKQPLSMDQAKLKHDEILERLRRLGVPYVIPVRNGVKDTAVATGAE